jgi:adenine-specific DNA-methyltransferase
LSDGWRSARKLRPSSPSAGGSFDVQDNTFENKAGGVMSQKFEKLKALLKELFQLDQPDLDFGLYRIMHAKSAEVTQFLDKDLLPQVRQAFGLYKTSDKAELEKELAKAIEQAQSLGADPETLPKVKELRAKIANDAVDIGGLENEVYDHLFSFFRRYYSEGDFLAKRVYRPGVYAIPYEGEEVKLHWANRDQYYIKTSEYLRDYAFRLRPDDAKAPMRVHFRLVDAVEGQHGSVKVAEGKDRVFILAADDFIAEEDGGLILRFAYRPATVNDWPTAERDGKTKPPTQKELSAIAVSRVLGVSDTEFAPWIAELAKLHVTVGGETPGHSRVEGHLRRYTARNTFDYFIHKDLGLFLRRELDFYVKNEVMHLDDIESETVARVEQYLSKIKVIRRIAGKIIDFLGQLEDFQKKLWLKKKFVVETQYCITLDRIPEDFYSEIASNEAQRDEWVRLFAIDEIEGDLTAERYIAPMTVKFLKDNTNLSIDTRHFVRSWTDALIAAIDDIDRSVTGVFIHSENSQALNLIQRRWERSIAVAYLDPPYNTDAAPIAYKNGYQSSTWVALMQSRLSSVKSLMSLDGVLCVTIDDYQYRELGFLIGEIFGSENVAGTVAIRSNPSGRPTPSGLAQAHEYAIFAKASSAAEIGKLPRSEAQARRYRESDEDGSYMWELFRKRGSGSERADRRTLYYPIFVAGDRVRVPKMRWQEAVRDWEIQEEPASNETVVWPIDENGTQRRWRGNPDGITSNPDRFKAKQSPSGDYVIYYKFRPGTDGVVATTSWVDAKYSATEHGTGVLRNMFSEYNLFDFPKSVFAVEDCLRIAGVGEESDRRRLCLDCFAGSGTTGHAIINLNRADGSDRSFILIEAEQYFDTVLMPRMRKASYSPEWSGARPVQRRRGVSFAWKYVRLESYEDALNNLVPDRTTRQSDLLAAAEAQGVDRFKEQYILRYMLDVEMRGSQSLLNIKAFSDPTAYKLKVKRPGGDESREVNVDLLETFNWLIGLTVQGIAMPQSFSAEFGRDAEGRLTLKGRLRQDATGPWWFRTVTGSTPDGRRTLIIWRKLTGNAEQDSLVLDTWFTRAGYSAKDSEFGLIYVNGDNNLENLKTADDTWKVRLIEEDFHRLMFDTEGL